MKLDTSKLRQRVHVSDGAYATALAQRGLPPAMPAEAAVITHPELVRGLAREYIEAGAGFVSTCTFSTNRLMAARRGLSINVRDACRQAARLARAAAGDRPVWVAGVIGPSGRLMALSEAPAEELRDAFAEAAEALASGGADALLLETFSELEEALLAVETVRAASGLPVIACMSFDSGPQRTRTVMGAEAGACAAALQQAGADVIGCNCGAGISQALPAVVALRAATDRPLWVKPSVGLPDLDHGRPVYPQTPEEFCEPVPTLLDAGVDVIGGCCGTTPEHIRRLAAVVHARDRRRG